MNISNLALTLPPIFNSIFYIFVAIMVLLLMITIHELGHYIAAKKLGFKVNEFAVGFGKKLISKTNKDGEVISLRAIPLGGFCAIEGEDEDSDNPNAFNRKEPWKRLIVLFAGVFFNFVSAIIFAVILLTAYGNEIPEIVGIDGDSVVDNPNYEIIQVGDVIWGVNGSKIDFINDNTIDALLRPYEVGEDIILNVERDGERIELTVELYEKQLFDSEGEPVLDEENNPIFNKVIGMSVKPHPLPFFTALAKSVPFVFNLAWRILSFFWLLITGQVSASGVGGPITTIGLIATYTQTSFANFLVLLPLIAANLAVFNLLPLPALDGSRMVFVAIEWVRGKPVNRKIEGYIHAIGLIVLLSLVLLLDLFNLIT